MDDNYKESLEEKLAQLRQGFVSNLPLQIKDIQRRWEQVRSTAGETQVLETLYRVVHSLIGSSGTFGFTGVCDAARNLEHHLKSIMESKTPVSPAEEAITRALVMTLVQAVETALKQEGAKDGGESLLWAASRQEKRGKHVFLVEDDRHVCDYLQLNLETAGYQVRTFNDTVSARQAIEKQRPDALIMDIMFPEGRTAGLEAVIEIRALHHLSIPVIFLSARDDLEARLMAVRAGGDAYLIKPVNIQELLQRLAEVIPRDADSMRILIVEDDTRQAEYYALGLKQGGLEVEILNEPMRILEVLPAFKPGLILMGLSLPDIRGDELASLIRQDKAYSRVPIIYLSAEASLDEQLDALRHGGDDFLLKPVQLEQLLEAVQARLRRAQELSGHTRLEGAPIQTAPAPAQQAKSDRERFMHSLESLSVGEQGPESAMLFVEIDDYADMKTALGIRLAEGVFAELAELLQGQLGEQDSMCRCTGASLALLLRGHTHEAVHEMAEGMRTLVAGHVFTADGKNIRLTCSLGIAFSGKDEKDAFELLERADLSCKQAQAADGNKIIEHQPQAAVAVRDEHYDEWVQRVRAALKNKGFFLVYQPIVSLHGDAVENYEVLLRMRGEDGESYMPGQFLAAAGQAGLMPEIDRWVLEEAARKLVVQQQQGQHEHFFIKLSAESLATPGLTEHVTQVMSKNGLFGSNLVFEVAEQDAGAQLQEIIRFGRELAKRGCSLLIEHFSGEDRAFKLLSMLPVQYVRLHRDLIRNLHQHAAQQRLSSVVDRLAADNKQCIASFIEDAESLTVLFQSGVGYVQGFFTQAPSELLLYDFRDGMG